YFFIFFFSSRRRHTRFSRDWSSDVCSSDLINHFLAAKRLSLHLFRQNINRKIHSIVFLSKVNIIPEQYKSIHSFLQTKINTFVKWISIKSLATCWRCLPEFLSV